MKVIAAVLEYFHPYRQTEGKKDWRREDMCGERNGRFAGLHSRLENETGNVFT
jgi:hypothetical protein